jgi:4-methyl-5(b-hydroxyethyl)-thiazole monophosphate biosynthesis
LADGFEEIEALTAVDLLRRADIKTEIVSIAERLTVTGAHGTVVVADIFFDDAVYDKCEMIVLPGGMPGASNLAAHDRLRTQLHAFSNQGKWLAAICAAPMALGRNGLLKGRQATCYPGFEKDLEGADILSDPATPVVVDEGGRVITSRGPATAIPFALALVKALAGESARAQVAKDLLWE